MQRTIYDFLYRKYDFSLQAGNVPFRSRFAAGMKAYWVLKLLVVTLYFAVFLLFVGQDKFMPEDTYWFVGSVFVGFSLITLSYLNVFGAWFAITLSKHRKWIDTLLIISGLLLCIQFPVYTFGEAAPNISALRESLILPGILLIIIGLYRKIHYRSSGVVQLSALVSLLVTAGILVKYPLHYVTDSIYLGFILLINVGFIADLILFYYWHNKLETKAR